jgi:hypothetical protein
MIFTLQTSLEVSVEVDPVATLTPSGLATFTGTVHCSRPAFVELGGNILRKQDKTVLTGVFTAFDCDGVTSWQADIQDDKGFRLVPNTVEVTGIALFTDQHSSQEVSARSEPTAVRLVWDTERPSFTTRR